MKTHRAILAVTLALCLGTPAFAADCYADYKAKQDNPLRLQYGVVELPQAACGDAQAAAAHLAPRLSADGWTLLQIEGTFGPEGLASRRAHAGQSFLRY
ncbi:hypothetical protein [Roseicitreum antarcticum]|uniref:DUF4177 domain-containing protein n=1 Tax=Roseicitreum antarcticum TaxID=564137 RepID=A0A1H2RS27_9RHOB|nr:hypothetical protein [Roseicitreum antarcticum]SDW22127.1 hypothetical protein SAMN04488238_101402 [Roseicitreum antarcticum]